MKSLCITDYIPFLITIIIYNLQFGFRKQYSTSHALINITENIRKALDDGNTGCGVFVDLQKTFDTVVGVSNDWFKSYLFNRNQYVSINGFDSGLTTINCGVPQGSVLGPLLLCLSNSIKKLNELVNADQASSSLVKCK